MWEKCQSSWPVEMWNVDCSRTGNVEAECEGILGSERVGLYHLGTILSGGEGGGSFVN